MASKTIDFQCHLFNVAAEVYQKPLKKSGVIAWIQRVNFGDAWNSTEAFLATYSSKHLSNSICLFARASRSTQTRREENWEANG